MNCKLWVVWLFVCAASAFAQEVTIRSDVPLVVIPATVTDQKGQFITGLEPADFLVLDDHKQRHVQVDTVDSGIVPVSLVIAVQCNGISGSALAKIRKMGSVAHAIAGEEGEAAVIAFDDEVKVQQNFTHDAGQLTDAFQSLSAGSGNGRLIDAVEKGIAMLETQPANGRRMMLTISESRDRGSKANLADVVAKAQTDGVTIYTATYSAFATPFTAKPEDQPPAGGMNLLAILTEPARLAKKNAAATFANATGGGSFSFFTQKALENGMMKISREVHNQYLLSFTPEIAASPEFRRIEVKVKDWPEAIIRCRPGYWAAVARP